MIAEDGRRMKARKSKTKESKPLMVEETNFDAVLAQLLKSKPKPMDSLKTRGRKGPKSPIIPARKSES
jgi:hypothetical protein